MPTQQTRLGILLETIYRGLGVKQAEKDLRRLETTSGKTDSKINKLAMDMGGFRGRVDQLHRSLTKATPKNLEYARSFEKIKRDLEKGKISVGEARTAITDMKNAMGEAAPKTNLIAQGIARIATAAALLKGAKEGWDFLKESTLIAARVGTLAIVTETLGRNVGYTTEEIRDLEAAIQEQGITTQGSRQAIAQMIQANLDLADSTRLARLAQDAAVISGENSSQAFQALVTVIATGNTLMARRRGILVDFMKAYQDWAAANNRTVDSLTQVEKVMIRTNEVMAQGENIAGAYTAAMDTAGKKLTSFPRYTEEFKVAFGENFVGALGGLVDMAAELIKTETALMQVDNKALELKRKGLITSREVRNIRRATAQDGSNAAKVMEDLVDVERRYNEMMSTNVTTHGEYIKSWLALQPVLEKYGIFIDVLSSKEWEHHILMLREAERLAFVTEQLKNKTVASQAATIATADAARADEEYFLQTKKVQQISLDVAQAYEWKAIQAEAATRAQERLTQAMSDSFKEMTRYDDLFDAGRWDARTGVIDNVTQAIIDQMEHFANLPATDRTQDMFDMYLDLLKEMDPAQAKAMETSQLYAQYMEQLFDAFERGLITTPEFAEAITSLTSSFTAMGVPVDVIRVALEGLELPAKKLDSLMEGVVDDLEDGVAPIKALENALGELKISGEDWGTAVQHVLDNLKAGKDPFIAIKEFLDDLNIKTAEVAPKITERLKGMMEPEMFETLEAAGAFDDVKDDLDEIADKADDGVLDIEDRATSKLITIQDRINEIAQTHTATIQINTVGSVPTIDLTDAPGIPLATAMVNPVVGRVPGGHTQDSYGLRLRTGEDFAVWNRNQNPPNIGAPPNVTVPVEIGEVSSEIDIDELLLRIQRRVEETS